MSRLRTATKALTAVGVLAVATVGAYEGLRTKAYRDIVGVPTICFGETRGVKMGDRATVDECKAMLADRLVEFETGIAKCVKNWNSVPDVPAVQFLSLGYNVGLGAFCGSTLVKKLNRGDIRGACNELPRWNRAGGKVVRGLVIRRAQEQKDCLRGLQ